MSVKESGQPFMESLSDAGLEEPPSVDESNSTYYDLAGYSYDKPPKTLCFFCSGNLPCREHKPRAFADLDFQEYVMGYIDGDELMERQGVSGVS